MLELLADRLPADSAVTYTGRMSAGAKAFAANRFETDPECRVFLSSHAGAFGTDLWMANYLINYDLAWSSGKQDQINKRHDRASSKFKNIYVLNAITAGTTEPRKLSMLAHKRRIGAAITDGRGADDKGRIENDVVSLTQCLEAA
jgi:SNF2 family DNA or RNA helicase